MAQSAVIFGGIDGLELSEAERSFFKSCDPWGYILFARNCETPDQVRALTDSLRELSGREKLPILIDQEGGRVTRLKPPTWREAPAGACFGACYEANAVEGLEAVHLNSLLLAKELLDIGVNVDCLPVLDVPAPDGHDIIGDRAYGKTPDQISTLGEQAARGLMEGGVLPVIKHIPGHGRAIVDSHKELPRVKVSLEELRAVDFEPFKKLVDLPLAMTAHIVYDALDPDNPATLSEKVIGDIIRDEIGFEGLLMTDDLSMKALNSPYPERAKASLDAGCDVVLHCNGDVTEMEQVALGCRPLEGDAAKRAKRAESLLGSGENLDWDAALARFDELIKPHLG